MSAKHQRTQRQRLRDVWIMGIFSLSFFITAPTFSSEPSEQGNNAITPNIDTRLQKLDSNGQALKADAPQWSCVKDQETDLTWEKRDPSTALHGHDTYVWYQPEQSISGTPRPHPDDSLADNTCYGFNLEDPASFCNSSAYAERVNQSNYCGYSDWRLPTANELLSLASPQNQRTLQSPLIDSRFFPFHDPFLFWTNTTNDEGVVLTIFQDAEVFANSERTDNISIRLVRGNLYQHTEAIN